MGGRKFGLAIRRKNRERKNKERKGEARRRLTMTFSTSPELLKVPQLILSLPLAAYIHSEVESLYSYSYIHISYASAWMRSTNLHRNWPWWCPVLLVHSGCWLGRRMLGYALGHDSEPASGWKSVDFHMQVPGWRSTNLHRKKNTEKIKGDITVLIIEPKKIMEMVLIWNQKRIIDLEWFFNKNGSYQKSEFGKVEWVWFTNRTE